MGAARAGARAAAGALAGALVCTFTSAASALRGVGEGGGERAALLADIAELALGDTLRLRSPLPEDVECSREDWCDAAGRVCVSRCARGTVAVSPWLQHAIRTNDRFGAEADSMCNASLAATHNSAITLADGFGARDAAHSAVLARWLGKYGGRFVTNNQLLSLTDQLNLGVRALELDVHFFMDELRIAHCGGLQVPAFDRMVRDLNAVLDALGLGELKWDTETVGCDPSLSGLPAKDQRSAESAVEEIAEWIYNASAATTGNGSAPDAFVTLFLDDNGDLVRWRKVAYLEGIFERAFARGGLLTPSVALREWPELGSGAPLPSIRSMLDKGYRALVYSATDLSLSPGSPIWQLGALFSRCGGYSEGFNLKTFEPAACKYRVHEDDPQDQAVHLDDSSVFHRMLLSELQYGPLDGDFSRLPVGASPVPLDRSTVEEVASCGVNEPAPDELLPERASGFIWTWAPGEPSAAPTLEAADDGCAFAAASDGRWHSAPCHGNAAPSLPAACRRTNWSADAPAEDVWLIAPAPSDGQSDDQPCAAANHRCPVGSAWAAPTSARDGALLGMACAKAAVKGAWINLHFARSHHIERRARAGGDTTRCESSLSAKGAAV